MACPCESMADWRRQTRSVEWRLGKRADPSRGRRLSAVDRGERLLVGRRELGESALQLLCRLFDRHAPPNIAGQRLHLRLEGLVRLLDLLLLTIAQVALGIHDRLEVALDRGEAGTDLVGRDGSERQALQVLDVRLDV